MGCITIWNSEFVNVKIEFWIFVNVLDPDNEDIYKMLTARCTLFSLKLKIMLLGLIMLKILMKPQNFWLKSDDGSDKSLPCLPQIALFT